MDLIPPLVAGVVQTVVGHPIDTIKTRIQNNMSWKSLSYKSYYKGYHAPFIVSLGFNSVVFPTHKYLYNKTDSHVVAGAVAGIIVTPMVWVAEVIKTSKQTGSKQSFCSLNGLGALYSRETIAMSIYFSSFHYIKDQGYNSFVAGGASGVLNWGITYPLDVIKTRQIAQGVSFKTALSQGRLHSGLGFTLLRAMLVNSCVFYTYEKTTGMLNV